MSIPALSNAGYTQLLQANNLSGFQQAVQSLGRSLGSGNLPAAKTALNQLQQLNANQGKLGGNFTGGQLSTQLSAVGAALQSGNLASAKTAFAAVQKDLTGSNAAAVTAAADAATEIAGQIDAVLGLTGPANSSGSSLIGSLLGGSGSSAPDIASRTTSILSSVYGNHSSSTASSSGNGAHLSVTA